MRKMDTVTMLRDLWRHRTVMVGVLLLSVLAGTLILYKFSPPLRLESRNYEVGVATTSVLIDTPSSQVAEIAPEGTDQLGVRADLLARLMVDGAVKAEIAQAAGLDPDALFGVSTATSDHRAGATPPRGAPVLTTSVVLNNDGVELPIVQIEAQAIDAPSAARLADAAVEGVRGYVDDQAAGTHVPDERRVRVSHLGATQAATVVRGPKTVFGLAAGIFVFGLGCACIIGFAALMRAWHASVEAEFRLLDDDVAWLKNKRVGAQESEPPAAVTKGPLRPAEPIRPTAQPTSAAPNGSVAPPAPASEQTWLRPANGAPSAPESVPADQARANGRTQRRRSASRRTGS
jgi:hypothetical protein